MYLTDFQIVKTVIRILEDRSYLNEWTIEHT